MSFTSSDYYHEENDHEVERLDKYTGRLQTINNKPGYFGNQGKNVRVEFHHTPVKDVSGLWGVQWQKQESFAHLPHEREEGQRYPLIANTNKQVSIFGLERWQANDKWAFEFGTRFEKQSIPIDYSEDKLDRYRPKPECWDWGFSSGCSPAPNYEEPDLTTYKEKATSYSIGTTWDFKPDYRLSATYSHNERLPTPMELYYHGKHLATHSFEFGNIGLDKEKSDNLDLGISFFGDKWSYAVSAYHSRFKNYIYNENIYREGNLYIRRYNQTTAKFYGLEGEMTFHASPDHDITLFGDMVRGKIGSLAPVKGKLMPSGSQYVYVDGADEMRVDEYGEIVGKFDWRGNPNPDYEDAESCTSRTPQEWFDEYGFSDCVMTVNVYKNGTTTPSEEDYDWLERPATNAPRVPPMRLGVRWQGYFGDKWSANAEYSHVFEQNKVSSSTIAIKPAYRDDNGELILDDNDRPIYYYHPENPLTMQARTITENVTKGYNLLNLGLDYHNHWGNLDYTLSLRANNVLDEKVYIHNSFLPFVSQMGRNFSLSANFKF